MRRLPRWMTAALLAGLAACASSSRQIPDEDVAAGTPTTRSSRDFLTVEELESSPWPTLFEAIGALRGSWLRTRGPSNSGVIVYLDGNRLGGVETLRTITTSVVTSAHFLTAPEAQARFGINHPDGAIVVVTRP